MNPAITQALARLSALKDLLGNAASGAGHFIVDEAKGTLANLSPAAVAGRYAAVDQAAKDRNDAIVRAQGYPGGVAQFQAEHPNTDGGNMLGDFAHSIVNAYRKVKKKL